MECLQKCLVLLLLLFLHISDLYGYDRTLDFDAGDCDKYEFYDMTQYQSYLVNWKGSAFFYSCLVAFHGENLENVATYYQVCFKIIDFHFDGCDVKVEFFDGLLTGVTATYDCNRPMPDKWCTEYNDYGKMKIEADKETNSRLQMEVTVTAGTSLTIVAAVLIALGILVVLGIAITVCIVWSCKRNSKGPSTGRVITTTQGQGTPQTQGQLLVGYPTQQTEMVPAGRGLYGPHEVTVQHSVMVPSNVQPQVINSSQSNSHPQGQMNANSESQQQHNSNPAASAPPPSYEDYMQSDSTRI